MRPVFYNYLDRSNGDTAGGVQYITPELRNLLGR